MQPERIPKVPFQLNLPEDLMQQAREAALKEGRTLSNWIDNLLRITLPKPEPKPELSIVQ